MLPLGVCWGWFKRGEIADICMVAAHPPLVVDLGPGVAGVCENGYRTILGRLCVEDGAGWGQLVWLVQPFPLQLPYYDLLLQIFT
jgi:hypothetical protein